MWVRRLAVFAALLTFVLIVAGGLVTNTDSGLACPDWPLCHGSAVPKMVGGVAVEHTHPLLPAPSMLSLASLVSLPWRFPCSRAPPPALAPPLLFLAAAAVYLQIALGAAVRHTGAGLVCVDLPYCRGAIWPSGVHPAVHLHMAHRAFAFVVLGLVGWNAAKAFGTGRARTLALAGPALVLVQIVLGVLTISTFKDLVPVTAHLFVAALLLADLVSLVVVAGSSRARVPAEMPALGAAT